MRGMRLTDRRNKILELLAWQEELPVSQLISVLQVSHETVRKDLIEMERQGLVRRTHGRVSLVRNSEKQDDEISRRAFLNQEAKERIAAEVVRHVPEGDFSVGLDVGNTTWHVAKQLVKRQDITVVTNSLDIAQLYAQEKNSGIQCTGGTLRVFDNGFYGYWTRENLKSINMCVSVLGTSGIMELDGIGAVSFDDRDVKKLYVKNSQFVIAAFDSSKCTRGTMVEGVPWSDIDLVVTDEAMPEEDRRRIRQQTELIIV